MRSLTPQQTFVNTLNLSGRWARFRCRDATPTTTIAVGSSGATAPTTLLVGSTTGWPNQGTGIARLSNGGNGVFTWTGLTGNSFTGCVWSTTTTLASTGGLVASTPDYSNLGGANGTQNDWMLAVQGSETIDEYVATVTINLQRDNFSQSLSPLLAESVWNQSGQALAMHRECWIETALLPMNGVPPGPTDWIMRFHGFIDTIEWGTSNIAITATDQGGELQKTQIELVRNYGVWDAGHNLIVGYRAQASIQVAVPPDDYTYLFWFEVQTAGVTQGGIWKASSAYVSTNQGDIVTPTVPDPQGQQRYFQCTVSGTSGTSEPTWPAFGTSSPTVVDNGVTWTLMDIDASGGLTSPATPDPTAAWLTGTPAPIPLNDGTTIAEFGSSTLVWVVRVPNTRATSHVYALNQVMYTVNGAFTQYWICVASGTSTSSASTAGFPTTPSLGQVVTDNTGSGGSGSTVSWSPMGTPGGNLAETVIQQLLNDNNQRISLTLVTVPNGSQPNSGMYFGPYQQQQEDVLTAVSALALQIGYDIRMLWNAATTDFSLTLSYVNRANVTPSSTFAPSYYTDIQTLEEDISYIRTAIGLTYTDNSVINGLATSYDVTVNSTPQRKYIVVPASGTSAAITSYGRIFASINEGNSLQTDNPTSALNFANTVLSDLSAPILEHTVLMVDQPQIQLNDMVQMDANFVHYDSNQIQAVVSHVWSIPASGLSSSTIQLRGAPTAGLQKYFDQGIVQAGPYPTNINHGHVPSGSQVTNTVNGSVITFNPPFDPKHNWQFSEIHISSTSGFTPTPQTLKMGGVSFNGVFHVTGLNPGTTYYARVIHRFAKNVASNPCAQIIIAPAANKLINVDLTIRQNLYAFVATDYTHAGSLSFAVDAVTNATIGNKIGYDSAGLWNNSVFSWTPNQPGKYTMSAVLDATGVLPGDTGQLLWVTGGVVVIIDCSGMFQATTDDTSGSPINRIYALWQTTFTVTAADVSAGTVYGLLARVITSQTITIKAPSASSAPYFPGTQLTITQQLS